MIESGRVRGKGRFSDSDPVLAIFSRCFLTERKNPDSVGFGAPPIAPNPVGSGPVWGAILSAPVRWRPASPTPSPASGSHCSSVGGLHCMVWHEQHHDHYRRLLARTRGCGRGVWGGGIGLVLPNTPRRHTSQPPTAMVGPQRSGAPVQCGWHATLVAPGRGVGSVQVSQYRVQEVGSRPEKPPAINTTHWRHTLRPACACCADPRVGGRLLQLTTPT